MKSLCGHLRGGRLTTVCEIVAKFMKKTTKLVVGGKETELKDEQLVNGVYKIPIEICFNNSEDDCIRTAYNFTLNEELIQSEEEVVKYKIILDI